MAGLRKICHNTRPTWMILNWLLLTIDVSCSADSFKGIQEIEDFSAADCSFSKNDFCRYKNLQEKSDEPQWSVSQYQQSANQQYQYGRRYQMNNGLSYLIDKPPHGQYYVKTGPTANSVSHGKFALLSSPSVNISTTEKCLYFSYHNRAPFSLIPTLEVRVRPANGSRDMMIAEYFQTDVSKWFEASIPLPVGEYHVIFAGKNYYNGTTSGGLIAVTGVVILHGGCGETVPDEMKVPGDCGFEDAKVMCGYSYTNDSTTKMLPLRTEGLPAVEQQMQNQRGSPTDTFLVMNQRFFQITNHDSRARLQSPELDVDSEGCLHLWYFNNIQTTSDDGNALNIYQLPMHGRSSLLFCLPIQKTYRDRWYKLTGALPSGRYTLIIEAIYSNDYAENNYVGIDNIEIFNRSCSEVESLPDICTMAKDKISPICKNGGTCTSLGKKSFRCVCPDGFYGDRCEFSYPCKNSENACINGGTCVEEGRTAKSCQCQMGFIGERCEERRKCGSPQNITPNIKIKQLVNDTYQSRVLFECVDGYHPTQQLSAVCSGNGVWSVNGQCLPVDCGQPPATGANRVGKLVHVTNTTTNGEARYECIDGYVPYNGLDVLRCLPSNGLQYNGYSAFTAPWRRIDGGDNVQCQAIPRCGSPPGIRNARLVNVTNEFLNGVATYECVKGFQMNPTNSSNKMICSSDGRWKSTDKVNVPAQPHYHYGNQNVQNTQFQSFQCWSIPDCGSPPNITDGHIVSITNTTEHGAVEYRCDRGYHMDGIHTAICTRINSDPLTKAVDWMFVPSCHEQCVANIGLHGNVSSTMLEISDCTSNTFEKFTTSTTCQASVMYTVKRKQGKKLTNEAKDSVVFYGSELCIGARVNRIIRFARSSDDMATMSGEQQQVVGWRTAFQSHTLSNITRCKTFCMKYPSEVYYLTVNEDIQYTWKMKTPWSSLLGINYDSSKTVTQRKVRRYVLRP